MMTTVFFYCAQTNTQAKSASRVQCFVLWVGEGLDDEPISNYWNEQHGSYWRSSIFVLFLSMFYCGQALSDNTVSHAAGWAVKVKSGRDCNITVQETGPN